MIFAATGHRPDKLNGYSPEAQAELTSFAAAWIIRRQPSLIITGMALGWDQAIASAAASLSIPFIAAVPFPQQSSYWSTTQRQRWRELCTQAQSVHYVDQFFSKAAFLQRNCWMIDQAERVVALNNGGTKGGTAHAIGYAAKQGKPVENLWPSWSAREHKLAVGSPRQITTPRSVRACAEDR